MQLWILAILPMFCFSAWAQSSGILNASGDYAAALGNGAVTNRQTANQLYQTAMQHAAQAKATMNVGLGAQAFQEYRNAIKSDDQSHSFAQGALSGVNSGANSGQFDLNQFSSVGVNGLNDLVTTSSPYYSKAKAQAESYGLTMTEDRQYMKTPFGAFPVDMTQDEMVLVGSQIAEKYGIPADVIANGMQAGQANSQAIAERIQAAVDKAKQRNGKASAEPTQENGNLAARSETDVSGALPQSDAQSAASIAEAAHENENWTEKAKQIESFRNKLLKQMGREPMGSSDQDIFQMVHARYLSLEAEDRLIRSSETFAVHSFPAND